MRILLVALGEGDLADVRSFASSLDYEVAGEVLQKGVPKPRYLIGSGKADEVASLVDARDVDMVVFNNRLSPSQVIALEELIGRDVIDRFDLILNVFDQHTFSKEAKLQVELVRLKRNLPFVRKALGRRVKAEHPGYGGAGEFIVNSSIESIRKRIKTVEKRLGEMDARIERRDQERCSRSGLKMVSLAGYTNSGKSTLFNRLTRGSQQTDDAPFTTLQSKIGAAYLGGGRVLISDTIGFIEDLPHQLISAFRATLSCIRNSDLILLLCDIGETDAPAKAEICRSTLFGIGAEEVPLINVLNKSDKLDGWGAEGWEDPYVLVSAKCGDGIEKLKELIADALG